MTIVHPFSEVKLYPQVPNPSLSTLETKLFVRVGSTWVSLTSWDFTFTWCFLSQPLYELTGLDGTTQAQQYKAKQLRESLFPPKVANSY